MTYFCPALDPPLDGSGRKTTTLVRDLKYVIHTKFHQNPSSGSGEEVENANSLTDDGRTDAGQRVITIGHWSLWLLCPKNYTHFKYDKKKPKKQKNKTNKQKKKKTKTVDHAHFRNFFSLSRRRHDVVLRLSHRIKNKLIFYLIVSSSNISFKNGLKSMPIHGKHVFGYANYALILCID